MKNNREILFSLLLLALSHQVFSTPAFVPLHMPSMAQNSKNLLLSSSCDSTGLNCIAVGFSNGSPVSYHTTNGGVTWNAPTLITPPPSVSASTLINISCDSYGVHCIATGTAVDANNHSFPLSYTSPDSGASWSLGTQPTPIQIASQNVMVGIGCDASNQKCISVGYSGDPGSYIPLGYVTQDSGSTWNNTGQFPLPENVESLNLMHIKCDANALHCVAVGFMTVSQAFQPISYSTTDGGGTWVFKTFSLPDNSSNTIITQIACDSTAMHCVAVGATVVGTNYASVIYNSSDGGLTWSNPMVLNTPDSAIEAGLSAIACDHTGNRCTAIGFYVAVNGTLQSLSYQTGDGGNTWGDPQILVAPVGNTSVNFLFNISCDPLMQTCLAVGVASADSTSASMSYSSTDGGATWGAPTMLS